MAVHVWFDYGSLDSYLAWKRLASLAAEWKPVVWPGSAVDGTLAALAHEVAAAQGREREWMRAAFEAQWVHGRGIHRLAVVEQAAHAAGVKGVAQAMQDPGPRQALEGNMLEARLHGVAHVPAALVDGRLLERAGLMGLA